MFSLIWILAFAAAILLIVLKAKAHLPIIVLTCVLAVFAVLPVVGYQAMPVHAQVNRLEKLLVSQNMLQDNQLTPAVEEPSLSVRESITDAVNYLASAQNADLPVWFVNNLTDNVVFKKKLGFEPVWPKQGEYGTGGNQDYLWTSLSLPGGAIDVSDYHWAVTNLDSYQKGQGTSTIQGNKGTYQLNWSVNTDTGIPTMTVTKDDTVILKKNLSEYTDRIIKAYPPGQGQQLQPGLEEMSYRLETPEVQILLVFQNIEINLDIRQDIIRYGLGLYALYFKEK